MLFDANLNYLKWFPTVYARITATRIQYSIIMINNDASILASKCNSVEIPD